MNLIFNCPQCTHCFYRQLEVNLFFIFTLFDVSFFSVDISASLSLRQQDEFSLFLSKMQ